MVKIKRGKGEFYKHMCTDAFILSNFCIKMFARSVC